MPYRQQIPGRVHQSITELDAQLAGGRHAVNLLVPSGTPEATKHNNDSLYTHRAAMTRHVVDIHYTNWFANC